MNASFIEIVSSSVRPDVHLPSSFIANEVAIPSESVFIGEYSANSFPAWLFAAKFKSSISSNFTPVLLASIVPALIIGQWSGFGIIDASPPTVTEAASISI